MTSCFRTAAVIIGATVAVASARAQTVVSGPIHGYASLPGYTALSAGYNQILTTQITCPSNSCTVVLQDMVQVGQSSSSGNHVQGICGRVDSTWATPSCPVQGVIPQSDWATWTSLQHLSGVSNGTHTLHVYVTIEQPATLGNCEFQWSIYSE